MKEFLKEFLEMYATKFEYEAIIDGEKGLIKTQYGTFGFEQTGVGELKFLPVAPNDSNNDDQISSLIKIKKHMAGALTKVIAERNANEESEPSDEPSKKPAKKEHKTQAPLEKPAASEPPTPIPGTKAYADKQRTAQDPVNKLGNSPKAMAAAANATIGPNKKADPPDEPVNAEEATKPSLDDIMDGKVAASAKPPTVTGLAPTISGQSPPVRPATAVVQPPAPLAKTTSDNNDLVMEEAARKMAYIKILVSSPSGGGKTLGALLMARGLCDSWGEICIIDTENKSGALYVGSNVNGTKIGKYKTITLKAPYSVARYIQAMEMAEKNGIKVLIIDSLTHAWTADGGLLDLHTKITASSRSGNSYTAWKDVTPLHSKLIEKIQSCSMHVILTARSKMEHILEKTDKGTAPKKVGMGVVFREGIEYETSIAFEIDQASHVALATKDRTRVFADNPYVTLNVEIGQKIRNWLESAKSED